MWICRRLVSYNLYFAITHTLPLAKILFHFILPFGLLKPTYLLIEGSLVVLNYKYCQAPGPGPCPGWW